MKKLKTLLFIAATIFTTVTQAQVNSADSMVQRIFATLKAKDVQGFVALYPNAKQFGTMMRTMMEQMMNSEQMKEAMATDPNAKNMNIDSLIEAQISQLSNPEAFAMMEKKFGQTFKKVIEKGESKGVNWSDATLVSYTIDSSASLEDGPDMEMLKNSGLKAMKGVIEFKVKDSSYQLAFDKIIYIPTERGWFGGEFPQLAHKGESLQPEMEMDDMMMSDSTNTIGTDTNVAKPKAKMKAKTKTPTSKTKTKAKTPALKPKTKS